MVAGDADGLTLAATGTHGVAEADGLADGDAPGLALGEADGFGEVLAEGVALGLVEGPTDAHSPGVAWLRRTLFPAPLRPPPLSRRATGTTISPITTVMTKAAAPHSRRQKPGEFSVRALRPAPAAAYSSC